MGLRLREDEAARGRSSSSQWLESHVGAESLNEAGIPFLPEGLEAKQLRMCLFKTEIEAKKKKSQSQRGLGWRGRQIRF